MTTIMSVQSKGEVAGLPFDLASLPAEESGGKAFLAAMLNTDALKDELSTVDGKASILRQIVGKLSGKDGNTLPLDGKDIPKQELLAALNGVSGEVLDSLVENASQLLADLKENLSEKQQELVDGIQAQLDALVQVEMTDDQKLALQQAFEQLKVNLAAIQKQVESAIDAAKTNGAATLEQINQLRQKLSKPLETEQVADARKIVESLSRTDSNVSEDPQTVNQLKGEKDKAVSDNSDAVKMAKNVENNIKIPQASMLSQSPKSSGQTVNSAVQFVNENGAASEAITVASDPDSKKISDEVRVGSSVEINQEASGKDKLIKAVKTVSNVRAEAAKAEKLSAQEVSVEKVQANSAKEIGNLEKVTNETSTVVLTQLGITHKNSNVSTDRNRPTLAGLIKQVQDKAGNDEGIVTLKVEMAKKISEAMNDFERAVSQVSENSSNRSDQGAGEFSRISSLLLRSNNPTTASSPESQIRQSTYMIEPEVGKPEWSSAMGERLTWMARNNLGKATLHLKPQHLGPMEISISVHEDQASVTFQAHHAATREALEAAMPRLREMLQEAGIELADADVKDGSQGQTAFSEQSASQSEQQAGSHSSSGYGSPEAEVDEQGTTEQTLSVQEKDTDGVDHYV